MLELVGRDLSEAFEAGDLGVLAQAADGGGALLLAVAVEGLLLVAHAEEGRLEDVEVLLLDQVGEELKEEGDQQQADVHAVHVGIGGDDDAVVAQSVQAVLDVERGLQQVELLVLVDDLLGQAEAVERLTAEAEDGLQVRVAALGDRSAGRVALGDEEAALGLVLALGVVEVDAAVTQLAVVQVDLLGALAGQLGHAGDGLALLLRLLNLAQQGVGRVGRLVEVVVYFFLHEVAHELGHGDVTFGAHVA